MVYPDIAPDEYKKAILDFAMQRAKSMGLVLLSYRVGAGDKYDGVPESLGGIASHEYVDSGGGVRKDSKYKITGSSILYDPN